LRHAAGRIRRPRGCLCAAGRPQERGQLKDDIRND
jgi:hypothetical protein